MTSRRTLLAASLAGAAGAAALPLLSATRSTADTPATLAVQLANTTGSDEVYAYVTGQDPDQGNALMLLEADGQTVYHPSSPSSTGAPLGADCGITLNASGGDARAITIPHLVGGRLWFSIGAPLTFLLNPGPALVEPDFLNPSDPNIDIQWGYCELTYDTSQLYANISFVDFTALPIGMHLTTTSGGTQDVGGLPAGGVDTVASALSAQAASDGSDWDQLVVTSNGANLRVLNPSKAISGNSGLFSGYLDDFIDEVWTKYESTDLTIDTQYTWGTVTGRVSGGLLTFDGVGTFAKPSTYDVFNCSSGPFTTGNDEMGNLSARLAAAFNRTTLYDNANQPDGEDPSTFYTNAQTNHYARILHATAADGLGYAFPYDDVHPDGVDFEGKVQASDPDTLTVTVGAVHG
jgi:glycosyl hydrolase family 64 (putative beta-1,3-glucanase)